MDPLTIITSIPTLIDICKRCISGFKAMKDASKDCPVLLYEITNLETLLQRLDYERRAQMKEQEKGKDKDGNKTSSFPLEEMENHITRMRKRMEDISSKLVVSDKRFGSLRRAVKWPFTEKEVKELLADLERDKLLLNLLVQGDHLSLSQALSHDIKDIQGLVADIGEGVRNIQVDVEDLHERAADEEYRKILEWISPIPFWSKQRDLQRKYRPGAGTWFLESPEFQQWVDGHLKILNCTGIPGAGKTIISSVVVQHLAEHFHTVPAAYVFCDYLSQADRAIENILPSILRQIIQMRGVCSIELWELYKTRMLTGETLSLQETVWFLETCVDQQERVFVLFDALDELDDEKDVLEWVVKMSKSGCVSFMTTSRQSSVLLKDADSVAHVNIRADDTDVRQYVKDLIPGAAKNSPELQQTIIDGICEAVQGMFIIAALHMETLAELGTEGDIRRALLDFSAHGQSLDRLYQKVMNRIAEQPNVKKDVAHRLLAWLTKIRRPLSPVELRHAFAVREGDRRFQTDMLYGMDYLLATCKGLVEIDRESNVVRLVHKTAREFLATHETTTNIEEDIAETCLTYLSFDELLEPVADHDALQALIDHYPFLDYAAISWGYHANDMQKPAQKMKDKVLGFLRLPNRISDVLLEYWANNEATQRSLQIWKGERWPSSLHRQTNRNIKCHLRDIHIAILFGFTTVLKSVLLEHPKRYWRMKVNNPLCWAARLDRYEEMKIMIENGADVNVVGGLGWTPLHWACVSASLEMVRLLLDNGADVNQYTSEPRGNETPMHKACFHDRADVVEELLKRGADITAGLPGQPNITPLSYVLDKGRLKCLELLLFKYRFFTSENTAGLMIPIDDPDLLRRLLDTHVNPSQDFGLGRSMLDVAIQQRDSELIGKCLEHGALPKVYWTIEMPEIAQHSQESWFVTLHALIAGHAPPMASASRSEVLMINRDMPDKELYLEILTPADSPQVTKIIFTITSHDQGWSSFPHDHGAYMGSQSFFAADVWGIGKDGKEEVASKRKRIVYNVHASREWKKHVVVWERDGAKKDLKRWMEALRAGCAIRIYARATDWGWENHVAEIRVDVFA
ncbi:hypothetical protein BKA61DRAFT_707150 [Leptodontidium sp. MPI-SDFR-AT-0119]|nr:hypothetical protein BKA61DRAFT_707150 [Leptodontidium sp. MPI-SDFR-AT-0119]